jgi:acetyl-CoA carboxylase biotin carboxyl carrier protein
MSDKKASADPELIRAVWEEAREMVKRLEGSTVQRFAVEAGDTRIEIERGMPAGVVAGPAPVAAAAAPAADDGAAAPELQGHAVLAPLVGTFYSAPQPGAPPFVEEGTIVEKGQAVGIVEAMKLMNQVEADIKGKVLQVLVSDGEWVEFEQPLVVLEPVD